MKYKNLLSIVSALMKLIVVIGFFLIVVFKNRTGVYLAIPGLLYFLFLFCIASKTALIAFSVATLSGIVMVVFEDIESVAIVSEVIIYLSLIVMVVSIVLSYIINKKRTDYGK